MHIGLVPIVLMFMILCQLLGQCCQHEQLSPELGLAVFITSPSTEIVSL